MVSFKIPTALVFLWAVTNALAQVTVYRQIPLGQTRTDGEWATTTALAAYNVTHLQPPTPPGGNPSFVVQLQKDAAAASGLSIPHVGPSFFGFSIEMSVITQVLGKNSTLLSVPFLNLIANLQERAGGVFVRLGGNTQEFAMMVEEGDPRLQQYHTFGKQISGSTQTTLTPAVLYTRDMFVMCNKISEFVNIKWFLGIPFNDSVNWRLAIAEEGQTIMGDNLAGLQAANEPDFYPIFGRRQRPYGPYEYHAEMGWLIGNMTANPKIKNPHMLIGPSISNQNDGFRFPDIVETGYFEDYKDSLAIITTEHYPDNNCAAMFPDGRTPPANPQEKIGHYLSHRGVRELVGENTASANVAVGLGKPFIMFETNSASCGGFPGISDTFTAALWGMDYGLQMAASNYSHALLHVGGQNVYYNPFTAPPTNQSYFNEWTIGPVYYSALVLAEALGKTNTSRVVDLAINGNSDSAAGYAIYENNELAKAALINFADDRSGASDLTARFTVNGGVPASVQVKYLRGVSVNERNNITWAGQTFGNMLTADGRLRGALDVTNVPCDQTQNTCTVRVPAPGAALVFFRPNDELASLAQATKTFATTAWGRLHNTIAYDPNEVAMSNGENGTKRGGKWLGSTSPQEQFSGVTTWKVGRLWIEGVVALILGVTSVLYVF